MLAQMWSDVGPVVLHLASLLLAAILMAAANWLRRRLKLEVSEQETQALREVVQRGVGFAEESFRRKLKLGEISEDAKRNGQSAGIKLAAATAFIQRQYPKLAENTIVNEIEAELARMPDVGATGALTVTPTQTPRGV